MAVRGSLSKGIVKEKILETFKDSFENGSEIRIPLYENGEIIQIKVTLTAAKVNVTSDELDFSSPNNINSVSPQAIPQQESATTLEPTEEEKKTVEELLERLKIF